MKPIDIQGFELTQEQIEEAIADYVEKHGASSRPYKIELKGRFENRRGRLNRLDMVAAEAFVKSGEAQS